MVHRIISSESFTLTAASHDETSAKTYPWTARIVADNHVVNVAVGMAAEADADDYAIPANEDAEIAVAEGEIVSIYSEDGGKVWVSEVKCSA